MHGLRKNVQRQERGIALIMVLSLVALVAGVVADFQYSSRVGYQLAINARDELQAEYNALSALRLRALLLKQAGKINAQRKTLASLAGVSVDMIPPVGQLLEMIPVECGLISTIVKTSGGPFADEDGEGGGAFLEGECLATSTSEHAKISVNILRNQLNNRSRNITRLLLGLLQEPKLELHFSEDDRNGTHAETPVELVEALVDWTDANRNQATNGVGDEERHYMNLKDHYKVKNAPFDSLDEVQLVHGMDDELFHLLRDHMSIYTDGTQMELTTASVERIVLIGLPAAMHEGFVPEQLWYHVGFPELYVSIMELKQMSGFGMSILNLKVLTALVAGTVGDVIDVSALKDVFTDEPSTTWYTIEAEGSVGNASRRFKGVFQAREGNFYYMRVE